MSLDPFLTLTAQHFIALLMLMSGLHKWANARRFAAAISAYRLVAEYFVRSLAMLLMSIEVAIGIALTLPELKELAALGAAGLLALYLTVMTVNLLRGHRQLDCGCSFHRKPTPISGAHLIRNAVLIIFSLLAAMPESGRVIDALDGVQITAAVASLALIYLSAEALMAPRWESSEVGGLKR